VVGLVLALEARRTLGAELPIDLGNQLDERDVVIFLREQGGLVSFVRREGLRVLSIVLL